MHEYYTSNGTRLHEVQKKSEFAKQKFDRTLLLSFHARSLAKHTQALGVEEPHWNGEWMVNCNPRLSYT